MNSSQYSQDTVMIQSITGIISDSETGIPGRKRPSNGGSIPTEPLLCCFIPRGLIHWMCKDDGVTIGDQAGLTSG